MGSSGNRLEASQSMPRGLDRVCRIRSPRGTIETSSLAARRCACPQRKRSATRHRGGSSPLNEVAQQRLGGDARLRNRRLRRTLRAHRSTSRLAFERGAGAASTAVIEDGRRVEQLLPPASSSNSTCSARKVRMYGAPTRSGARCDRGSSLDDASKGKQVMSVNCGCREVGTETSSGPPTAPRAHVPRGLARAPSISISSRAPAREGRRVVSPCAPHGVGPTRRPSAAEGAGPKASARCVAARHEELDSLLTHRQPRWGMSARAGRRAARPRRL